MFDDESWGFYPVFWLPIIPATGVVEHNDNHHDDPTKTCFPVVVPCCDLKRDEYRQGVKDYLDATYATPPIYQYPLRACGWYVWKALQAGKTDDAKGCTENCGDFPIDDSNGVIAILP
jgi:hypothetical protein